MRSFVEFGNYDPEFASFTLNYTQNIGITII
jgi:hypothetical protein